MTTATELKRVEITQPFIGLVYMAVCAVDDATDEEILQVCNRENPSGTSAGWGEVIRELDPESMFKKDDNKLPVKCADHPGRTHYLVLC